MFEKYSPSRTVVSIFQLFWKIEADKENNLIASSFIAAAGRPTFLVKNFFKKIVKENNNLVYLYDNGYGLRYVRDLVKRERICCYFLRGVVWNMENSHCRRQTAIMACLDRIFLFKESKLTCFDFTFRKMGNHWIMIFFFRFIFRLFSTVKIQKTKEISFKGTRVVYFLCYISIVVR